MDPKEIEERKKRMSENSKGENNIMYGKHHTKETREKISKSLRNSEVRKAAMTSEEYRDIKRKQRVKCVELGKASGPSFNPKACKIFDMISKEKGVYIQHAMNEGEFCVKELGFYLDGYDAENNVAYEYDERHHFIGGKLIEKDLIRQQKIEEVLHCTFIRIKDEDYKDFEYKDV